MGVTSRHVHEPASRRLANELRGQIVGGDLSPGDRLPSERTLAETHGIARNTAREAVRLLTDEGLVTAEHGRGAFVRAQPRLLRFGQHRYSRKVREETGLSPFHAEVIAQGLTPNAVLDRIGRVQPPTHVAERLDVSPRTKSVVERVNWYFVDGEPVQIGTTYIPWKIAEGTELATGDNLGSGDLYARFEDQGYAITYTREEVTARMPTRDEARDLRMPGGVPLLVVTHTGLDAQRRPFELTEFKMRADHSGLDYTMKVDN
ncbi:GntR family transcriptional regulator [Phycicoccus flavus]|uniref:GntR family transcriptional regulator n=1 Tax=Phycicoccus flavus TaxID=2502783 RepID=UPI000FEB6AC6|nr:GntR family transcriptional regulator [Phycicoccus flavus]NHA69918.1 GntR family transcriptional regulator [Phycicoccus flavus]